MKGSKRKLIIDTDIGIDDGHVINFFVALHQHYEILAITLVAGNSHMEVIGDNCRRILKLLNAEHIPIYAGSSYNLLGKYITSDGYFGENAFANIELEKSDTEINTSLHSAQALLHYVKKYPNQVDLMCIGPFTNLALAFMLDETFPSLVHSMTFMGTDTNEVTTLNVTPHAEFNVWVDPIALTLINNAFTSIRKPILLVDWRMCRECFPYAMVDKFHKLKAESKSNKHVDFFLLIADKTNSIIAKNYHHCGLLASDLTAAAVHHNPSLIKTKRRVSLHVEIEGEKVGHVTFIDDDKGLFELVTSLDLPRLGQEVYQALTDI